METAKNWLLTSFQYDMESASGDATGHWVNSEYSLFILACELNLTRPAAANEDWHGHLQKIGSGAQTLLELMKEQQTKQQANMSESRWMLSRYPVRQAELDKLN